MSRGTSVAVNFSHLCGEWHPTKNNSLKFEDIPFSSNKKRWWCCKEGHEWEAAPNWRTAKRPQGCPYCSGKRVSSLNSIATIGPHLVSEWHSVKNGNLKFENVAGHSHKMFWWRCSSGHEYKARPHDRIGKGSGCPYCSGNKTSLLNSISVTHPHLKSEWHPVKNGDIEFHNISYGSNKKVWWICKLGHEWEANVYGRTGVGSEGCPYCARRKVSDLNFMVITHPHLKSEWHPTKNDDVKFGDVGYGSKKYRWWICHNGHEWEASPNNRTKTLKPSGCPSCYKPHSKAELEVFDFVKLSFLDAVNGAKGVLKNKRFELDIWVPSLKKAIEYNGQWYHSKLDHVKRDARKSKECVETGIQLLTVTDAEYEADKRSTLERILEFLTN